VNVIIERLKQLAKKIQDQAVTGRQHIDSYRVFHGRGQTFSGLEFITVDYFQPVILVTLFAEPPQNFLVDLIAKSRILFEETETVFLVQRRYLSGAPSEVLWGDLPEQCFSYRGNLRFSLHLGQQQNGGFFLDMEPGRAWLEQQAPGKRILNLFAYTCAFSVVAVAANAAGVVNVDMSSAALNLGRSNHQLNGLDKSRSEFLAENILKSWGRIKKRGPYDLVIIDPPTYQKGSFIAEKDYAKVVRRLPELMPEGGMVLACLNAPELSDTFLRQIFVDSCPVAEFVERLQPHEDFPDVDAEQQLKLLVYRLPALDHPA
jgi:23S rRNA (cytosine1962-C5)-methyltransferase